MSVDEVRQASDQFYAALRQGIGGDPSAMFEICSHGDDVTTMHPIGGRQVGWSQVRNIWDMAAHAMTGGNVEVTDLHITMLGDDGAYTIGTETATTIVEGKPVSFSARCTNVYRRETGGWKIVHHHADLAPNAEAAFHDAVGSGS